ncbi:MAG: transcription elongation factor GreB [Bdellovibrionota bacterium]
MSKAFTKENDSEEPDELEDEPEKVLPAGGKNYMTPAGAKRLKDELAKLLKIDRPSVVQTVSWAASNGDRSENGDYIYGKRRLREIDRRIRFLTKRLDAAEIVDPSQQKSVDRVLFGATVSLEEEDGSKRRYSIVGIDESDPAKGKISWISPLARALLNLQVGDVATLKTPEGERELEIVAIEYRPID